MRQSGFSTLNAGLMLPVAMLASLFFEGIADAQDTTPPRITSIERLAPATSPTNADSVTWRVTFDEPVAAVTSNRFDVSGTTGALLVTNNSNIQTDVTLSGGDMADLDATVTLAAAVSSVQPGLTNVDNVTDDGTLELDGAWSVTTAVVAGITYLFAAGFSDDGVSVFSVAPNGSLTNVANVTDDATLELDNAYSVTTAVVGGTTYLFAAGGVDDGVSVFSVAANGSLTNVANVTDDATLELDGVRSVTTAEVEGTTYLFAAGYLDDGVSVFSVAANGSLTNVANVTDDATLELDGAYSVTTAVVGGITYLFAAGYLDHGVSVFSVAESGSLTNVYNVTDDATLELHYVRSVTTAEVGGITYLFAAGHADGGISVFSVAANGSLTNVANVTDDATLEQGAPTSVTTAVVGGGTYLFAATVNRGVSVFSVAANGSLTNVANVTDNATLQLSSGSSATTAVVGGITYLFAAGNGDDGVSVFSFSAEGFLRDLAGNALTNVVPTGTNDNTFEIDNIGPSVVTAGPAGTVSAPFTATLTYSEDVTGFTVDDIGVGNGTVSNFQAVSASVYTATITSITDGEVTIDVLSDVATDSAGNGNIAASRFSVVVDAINDAPIAQNDDFAILEHLIVSENLFNDNGHGADSDPNTGDSFVVSAANGLPGNVDTQITLPSGALLTASSNGAVSYDPNGAFALAPGATTQDSFTYTIADGSGATSSATVTVTVTGNTPPDAVDDAFAQGAAVYEREEVQISDRQSNTPFGSQRFPASTEDQAGNYFVAWQDGDLPISAPSNKLLMGVLRAPWTDEHYEPIEIAQINVGGSTSHIDTVFIGGGRFVVSWMDSAALNGNFEIYFSIVDTKAQTVTDPVTVDVSDSGEFVQNGTSTSLAVLSNGSFVISWVTFSNNTHLANARIYDGDGRALTEKFRTHETPQLTSGSYFEGTIIAQSQNGGFYSVYYNTREGAFLREFDNSGAGVGGQIASLWDTAVTSSPPVYTEIIVLPNGNLLMVAHGSVGKLSIGGIVFDPVQASVVSNFALSSSTDPISPQGIDATLLSGGQVVLVTNSSTEGQIYVNVLSPEGELGEFHPIPVNVLQNQQYIEVDVTALNDAGWAIVFIRDGQVYSSNSRLRPNYADRESNLNVLANDTDIDNDPLTITAVNGTSISAAGLPAEWRVPFAAPATGPVTLPSGSVVSLGDGVLDYDPTAAPFAIALPDGVTGDDSFTYMISDGAATDTANVTVTLNGVNDAPSADADTITVGEDDDAADVTATLLNGDTDPDTGETAQLAVSGIDTTGTQGQAVFNAGAVTYTSNGAFESLAVGQTASDSFGYTIVDPGGLTATANVTVTVNGANDAPTAAADALIFAEEEAARDVTATLLANDTDPDSGETAQLAVTAVDTTLTLGRITLANGVVTYDPNGAFNALAQGQSADDRFDYTISDPHGGTATATATVTVNGFNGYQLTVTTSGLGTGTVTSLPLGLNCGGGGGCTALFTQDTEVALSALVAGGTTFDGWGGDCLDPTQPLCVVPMTQNRSVSARFSLTTVPPGRIVAATLPGARSGYVGGGDITVFMTVLSRQSTPAQACRVTAANDAPFSLTYRQINAQNQVIGDANPLFDLTNGGGINFVLGLTPTQTTDASGYVFLPQIVCENADLAPIEGVNSVLVSIGASPVPDILSIGATPSADGVVRIPETGNRINFLSAAALNIGVGDGSAGANQATVTASVDTGAASLPVTLEVCETASTGGCITPRGATDVSTVFDQNVAKFFAVFVRANGEETVPFDPANARVFLRFADANGAIRSVTSAAISAPAPASDPAEAASLTGRWSVLVRQLSGDWPSLRRGALYVLEDGTAILDDGETVMGLTFEGIVSDAEITRFALDGREGLSAASAIRSGDALDDQPGALWGVRDVRSDTTATWADFAGDYGSLRIGTDGAISGALAGCIVHGAPQDGTGSTGLLVASVTLTACDASGHYTAVFDEPANDNEMPTLVIGGEHRGWRVSVER